MRALRRAVSIGCLSVLTSAGFLALAEQPAAAATTWYLATTGNNANSCLSPAAPCLTLPGVHAKAADGDTILVRAGTYPMGTAATRATITKALTITPENNPGFPGPVVFNGANAFLGTAILTVNAPGKTVSISDLAIQNGLNTTAAGVAVAGGTTVNASNLSYANLVGIPGGLSVAPTATYSQVGGTFSNNTAGASPGTGGNGGAVLIEGRLTAAGNPGTASFTNVTFQSNRALGSATANRGNGGAIYNSGALTLDGVQFATNSVVQSAAAGPRRGYGGSIFNGPTDADDAPTLTIGPGGINVSGGAAPVGSLSANPCPPTGSCLLHATLGGAIANVAVLVNPPPAGTTPGSITGGPVNISGAQALEGGGIFSTGTMALTGGTITNNRALPFAGVVLTGSGGGIFSTGTMSLDGMSITTNEGRTDSATGATALGGGVTQLAPGGATIVDTDITGNQTISQGASTTGTFSSLGGGLFNSASGSSVTGGNIRGNTANAGTAATTGNGGGVWNQGSLTVTGTTVSLNKAVGSAAADTGRGGGLFSGNGATALTLNGDAVVDGNTTTAGTGASSGNGGGIWNDNALTLDGVTVSANKATASATAATGLGGGVFTQTGSATVTGGAISANTSQGSNASSTGLGGGLYLSTGTATVTSTAVSDNEAIGGSGANSGLGGGIFNLLGTLTLNGPVVSGNTASRTTNQANSGIGGGLYNFFGTATSNAGLYTGNSALGGGGVANGNVAAFHDSNIDANEALAGGGVYNVGALTLDQDTSVTNNDAASGGGIVNSGSLTATNLLLQDNTATAVSAGTGHGGGLYNTGTATVTLSLIDGNRALHLAGAVVTGLGGAVFNGASPTGTASLTLDRTTVSDNEAVGDAADFQTGWGGAIYNGTNAANATSKVVAVRSTFDGNSALIASVLVGYNPGASSTSSASIRRSTASGNSTTLAGGGWYVGSTGASLSVVESTVTANGSGLAQNSNSTANVSGSILFGNGGTNCGTGGAATVTSGGHNLTDPGDTSCGFSGATDDVFADPQLGALASNGGPTATHLPGPSSPALDKIPPSTGTAVNDAVSGSAITLCVPAGTDQRGTTLPQGATCDIGSVERVLEAPEVTGPTSISFTVGTAGEVTGYTATGSPTPTLSATDLPTGLSLVSTGPGTAKISGTPAAGTGGVHNVTITATNEAGSDELLVELTVNEAPAVQGPTVIDLIETIDGDAAAYTSTGFPVPTLSITSGTLPNGVSFTPGPGGTATIDGAPAPGTTGTYNITITATNTAGTGSLNVTINVVPLLTITTTSLPDGQHGVVYSQQVTAIGGTPPRSFSLDSGSLPAGLSLAADGTISGIPSGTPGTSTFTVKATDSSTPQQTDTQELSITIGKGPTILTVDPAVISLTPLGVRVGFVQAHLLGGVPLQPIAGQQVTFKAGATTLCTATTDATGLARCTVGLPGVLALILAGGVQASYAGSTVWLPSSGSAGLIG
jgi:hypothetical protein